MPVNPRSLRRRSVLALLASLPATRAGAAPAAPTMPATAATPAAPAPLGPLQAATIMIAGPDGGALDRWIRVVQPALAQALPPAIALSRSHVGGPDGVTAANQFATRADPDGRTLLLTPPDAAIAWLAGDPRAKYDPGRWTALMAGVTPGILVARAGTVQPGRTVRLWTPSLTAPAMAGLLAVELCGAVPEPVTTLPHAAVAAALGRGELDAVLLRGSLVPQKVSALGESGATPVMALPACDPTGRPTRDAAFPTVPLLTELVAAGGPLADAYHAVAAAARVEFALVLPQLTPAARVAVWRHAAAEAVNALDVQSLSLALGVQAIGGADAGVITAGAVAPPAAQTALRQWLRTRFNWQPA